jgi:hypothetical protein
MRTELRTPASATRPTFAALTVATLLAWAGLPAQADCLAGAPEVAAAGVPDVRSIALADGPVVRLAGIEPFSLLDLAADDAEAALERRLVALIGSRPVRVLLLSDRPDRYGRLPALVAVGSGPSLQERVAGEGLALAFATGEPIPCFEAILAAEDEARRHWRGFWGATALPEARPEALVPLVGRFAIFEGDVLSVGNRPSRTYLNFGTHWSEDATVEIEAGDREKFGGEAGLAALAGGRVRVRGYIEARGGPVVAVRSPMQIERLGRAATADRSAP